MLALVEPWRSVDSIMIKPIAMLALAVVGVVAAMLSLLSAMDGNIPESAALLIGCVGALGMLRFVELRY